ncbi:MAG: hypothetical protein M3Q79_04170, partial [bacterium]|nr:hypothetical protein [bacterium]
MICIYCDGPTKISNSRKTSKGLRTWRRRVCQDCKGQWTTLESVDFESAYRVRKSSGQLEPFSWAIFFSSIYEACKHRKTAAIDAMELSQTILTKLQLSQQVIWPTSKIKAVSEQTLVLFDKTAAALYSAL